jgi:phage tail sheath protein FI
MAILSAGTRVNEFDFSEYAAQLGLTRFCVLGGATKGPLDTPTEVQDEAELTAKFGYRVTDDYGLQAAIQYLKEGDQLIFTRVADRTEGTGVESARVTVSGPAAGTPAVESEGDVSFTGTTNPADGDTISFHDTVPWLALENDNNGAVGNVAITETTSGARIAVTGMAGGDVSNPAVGTVKLVGSAMPLDGDQVVISDGSTSVTFEFDDDSAITGDVAVNINGITDPYVAMAALHTAINGDAFDVSSVNYADIYKYVFEFDDDASYGVGNLPVLIGSDAAESLQNLIAAFNDSDVDMEAVDGTISIPQMDVTHLTGGIDGNSKIATLGQAESFEVFTDVTAALESLGNNGAADWNDEVAMGFQVDDATSIEKVSVHLRKYLTPGIITVRIETDTAGAPSGTLVDANGTGTIAEGAVSTTEAGWIDCTLAGATPLVSGVQYWLVMTLPGDPGAGEYYSVSGDADNTYRSGIGACEYRFHIQSGSYADGTDILDAAFRVLSVPAIGVTGMTGGVDQVPGGTTDLMDVVAATPGTWANGMEVVISETNAIGAPAAAFDIAVNAVVDESGTQEIVERFVNVVLDSTSDRYIEKVVEEGIRGEVNASEFITIDVNADGDPTNGTYELGGLTADEGRDGITGLQTTDYIGTVTGVSATGLKAVENAEAVEFNVLAVPGVVHKDVIAALHDTAEKRADCIALPDPPFGLTKDEAIDWHNGDLIGLPNSPTAPLDTSYGALSWSWMRVYDDYNKQNIWLPPSGFVAARFAYTDRVAAPWFPAAGHNRGIIDADVVEYSPSQDDRDEMCPIFSGDNRVNPIVDFVGQGPTLFGNRTLQREWSQLTDVHVRRMLLHAEKLCATSVKYLVFEPNDPTTWKKFETLCNKHLADIASKRGLETFKVKCDASTNPVALRQQRRMRGKLYLVPQGAAEGIELDFAIFAAGAEFSET